MKCNVIGIDLSKNVFHFAVKNHRGKVIRRFKCRRGDVIRKLLAYPKGTLVCMEACQGSHNWCRELRAAGFDAQQIPAQHVKPYAKKHKNDYNDAEAIAEAGTRDNVNFVPVKKREQQELESVLGMRERLKKNRTALMNQARGMLAEQGVVLPKGRGALVTYLLSEMEGIGSLLRHGLETMLEELYELEKRIERVDKQLEKLARTDSVINRLKTIPGVGTITAIAMATLSGNPKEFKNGRQFAANLGVVPRQYTTGDNQVLLGISKDGDRARRSLLIIGAQSALRQAVAKKGKCKSLHNHWIRELYEKKGANLTAVALANKNARIVWKLLTTPGMTFDEQLCH